MYEDLKKKQTVANLAKKQFCNGIKLFVLVNTSTIFGLTSPPQNIGKKVYNGQKRSILKKIFTVTRYFSKFEKNDGVFNIW